MFGYESTDGGKFPGDLEPPPNENGTVSDTEHYRNYVEENIRHVLMAQSGILQDRVMKDWKWIE